MWKLTIEDDEGKKTLLPLSRAEYSVGRSEGNTVRLTERNISRKHASFLQGDGGGNPWKLADHSSYNGTYVNGERVVGERRLTHSDLVQLGDYRIYITNDDLVDDDEERRRAANAPDRLIMLVGPEVGAEYHMDEGPLSIGRSEECGASINHPSVSRVHAEVRSLGNGRYEVLDKGSANGIAVNGTVLRRGLLEAGDLIGLGDVKLRFLAKGQFMRPGAEASQQLAALSARQLAQLPGAQPQGMSTATKVTMGVAALAVMGMVAVAAMPRGDSSGPKARSLSGTEESPYKSASGFAKAKEWDKLHSALYKLPEKLRGAPDGKELFNKWADGMLTRADGESVVPRKKLFLKQVAKERYVDGSRRNKASAALASLSAGSGTDINSLPGDPKPKLKDPGGSGSGAKPTGTAPKTPAPGPKKTPKLANTAAPF